MKKLTLIKVSLMIILHATRLYSMNMVNNTISKTRDNVYGHGIMILDEIKKNSYKCNPNNLEDIHRCERGIEDLISQQKTDELVTLLTNFKEKSILPKVNSMFISRANAHIVEAYQKLREVNKVISWLNFCQLKSIEVESVTATKAKNFINDEKNKELKEAHTQLQQNVRRIKELIEGIAITKELNATGEFPVEKEYESMDTIYALLKKQFEK